MAAVEFQNIEIDQQQYMEQNMEQNQNFENIAFDSSPNSQLSESPLEEPYLFEGEEFYYYYYNNQFIPEEQEILGTTFDDDNQMYNINEPVNSILTWSPQIELQNNLNEFPYLYNGIIENDNFDSFNPFMVQPSVYNNESTTLGGNLLLTQPLSEVTQNVIENQQFQQYNWCDLSSYSDTQQFIIDNNISTKIAEQNNNNNNNNNISSENYYTPWTDFQLLEA